MRIENKEKNNIKKGFTLVEVIVSIGIFAIIMSGSSVIFSMSFKSYKNAKNVNENLKNAQFALNLMSKTFRTSSVVTASPSSIIAFDYSRVSRACIRYRFLNGSLLESRVNVAGATSALRLATCSGIPSATFDSAESSMTSGSVFGSFDTIVSAGDSSTGASTRVGKVTVRMNITSGAGSSSSSNAVIQSTSSLRDYDVANVGIDPNNAP